MTQDEIIRMAQKAGAELIQKSEWGLDFDTWGVDLEKFAALVAEATKEKAAKVCDEWLVGYNEEYDRGILDVIAAIRGMK